MGKTITIEPRFNAAAIQDYGDRHECRDPQSHVAARLEVLSVLSDLIEDEDLSVSSELVASIRAKHREATQEFLCFFASGPQKTADSSPEFRSGPSDEVLIALAKRDYGSEDIEIDTNAVVNRGEDPGAFVAAWVWVAFPEES